MYVVLSGLATLSYSAPPHRVLMSVVGAGEIIGVSALLSDSPRPFRADALSECKVTEIDSQSFRSILCREPANFENAMSAALADGRVC